MGRREDFQLEFARPEVARGETRRGATYKFITKPRNDEEIEPHIRRTMERHELGENRRLAREIAKQNDGLPASCRCECEALVLDCVDVLQTALTRGALTVARSRKKQPG